MTPARRDRFEQLVEGLFTTHGIMRNERYQRALINAFRAEHRAIVRLVKQQRDKLNPTIAVENWGKGYIEACDDLLAALTRRQKGTR